MFTALQDLVVVHAAHQICSVTTTLQIHIKLYSSPSPSLAGDALGRGGSSALQRELSQFCLHLGGLGHVEAGPPPCVPMFVFRSMTTWLQNSPDSHLVDKDEQRRHLYDSFCLKLEEFLAYQRLVDNCKTYLRKRVTILLVPLKNFLHPSFGLPPVSGDSSFEPVACR